MSRINMKVGITVEQVCEYIKLSEKVFDLECRKLRDGETANVDVGDMADFVCHIGEAMTLAKQIFGDGSRTHVTLQNILERAEKKTEIVEGAGKSKEARLAKMREKLAGFNGWQLMIRGQLRPLEVVSVVDGRVYYDGEEVPFIPVFVPNAE